MNSSVYNFSASEDDVTDPWECGCVLPSVCPDFELDGSANLEFIFLQGMLSEKEPIDFYSILNCY